MPSNFRVLAGWLAAAAASALAACGGSSGGRAPAPAESLAVPLPAGQTTVAFEVRDAGDLVGGASALGTVGDFILANEHVWVLIQRPGDSIGFVGAFGGDILDAGRNVPRSRGAGDLLSEIFPFYIPLIPQLPILNPRGALAETVEVLADGSGGGPAAVRVRGRDGFADILSAFLPGLDFDDIPAGLEFTTDYVLEPGASSFAIDTTIANAGASPVGFLAVGDVLLFGSDLRLFIPPFGFVDESPEDVALASVPYFAASGEGVSYGYVLPGQEVFLPVADAGQTGAFYDLFGATLGPGEARRATRHFMIGTGDVASIYAQVLDLEGAAAGTVRGRLADPGGAPVPGGFVDVRDAEGALRTQAKTDAEGRFTLRLPPGTWSLVGRAFGRADGPASAVEVAEEVDVERDLTIDPPGRLAFEVRETTATGSPLVPATLIFEALDAEGNVDPAAEPVLGPEGRAAGTGNLVYSATGRGTIDVPDGRYRVTAMRGVEYTLEAREVEIRAGAETPAAFTLARVVDTTGWIAADFHVHSSNSDDSPTPLRDRVESFLAVGVEYFAGTDHDYVSDYAPVIEAMGVRSRIGSIVGNEISTLTLGHFNGFPLTPDPARGDFGALDWRGMTAGEIYDAIRAHPGDQVAQMNHPRSDSLKGHLTSIGYEPVTGTSRTPLATGFSAIEVNLLDEVRTDWFSFLNLGLAPTAMGNSDTHRTFRGGPGFPVNFVAVGRDDPGGIAPDDVVQAILAHGVVSTNGPFVELYANDRPVGATVVDTDGMVDVRVRVRAAPWLDVDTVEIFANGVSARTFEVPASDAPERFDRRFDLPLARDTWIVAEVRGARSRAPRTGGAPKALTNPVWIDTDGTGFTPPGL